MIQTGDKRMAARARQATESGFQAKDPAQRRGDANRAVGVAAEAEMDQSGRHRRGRIAGRSAGDPRQIVRVACRAIVAVFGGKAIGVGVHIEHPAEQGAGAVQLAHRPAVAGRWRPVAQQFGAGEGGMPGDIKQIFHCVRNPCQRRQGALFPAQGVDAVGLRSMRWAVTSVQALICGFTRAISSSVWRAISRALSSPSCSARWRSAMVKC